MFEPLISVIICAYNVDKYIEKCIRSVINQSYRNLEIICVDDFSTDKTNDILHKYKLIDSRFKVISHTSNRGLSEARNSGIKHAKGDFISFIDGDDEIKLDTFEKLIPHFADKTIDVVWFGMEIIYEAQQQLKNSDANYYNVKHEGAGTITLEQLLDYDCSCCNKIFRRKLLTDNLMFHGRHYEDALFYMKFFAKSRKIFFVKEKYYIYYRHPVSIMSSTMNGKEGLSINHLFILDDLYKFWIEEKLLPNNNIVFNKIFAAYFWFAYRYCLPYERAWVIFEASKRLRAWDTGPYADPALRSLYDGSYEINLLPNEIRQQAIKKLNGLQKVFCIRNENQHKVIRLFGKLIASRKIHR